MWLRRLVWFAVAAVVAPAGAAGVGPAPISSAMRDDALVTEYRIVAAETEWRWSEERASARGAAARVAAPYQAEAAAGLTGGEIVIRIREGKEEVFVWHGHAGTVFACRGGVAYFAEFY